MRKSLQINSALFRIAEDGLTLVTFCEVFRCIVEIREQFPEYIGYEQRVRRSVPWVY